MAKIFQKIFLILLLAFASNLLFADEVGLEKIRKIVTDMSSDIKAEHIEKYKPLIWQIRIVIVTCILSVITQTTCFHQIINGVAHQMLLHTMYV